MASSTCAVFSMPPAPVARREVKESRRFAKLSRIDTNRGVLDVPARSTSSTPSLMSSSVALPQLSSSSSRHLFAVMRNMGSLYEEMARQLKLTGNWESVAVMQPRGTTRLTVRVTGRTLEQQHVSLLLGEKIPAERYIASSRVQLAAMRRGSSDPNVRRGAKKKHFVVNCVENMRCITLKGSMVSTLLTHHANSWSRLGAYLPLTFRLMPRMPKRDERDHLLLTSRQERSKGTHWIAKSSSGCHGDDVEIFSNTPVGIREMLDYIDGQKDQLMWVVQQYVDCPLLYHRRKFDVRCWVLLCGDKYEIYLHEQLVMRMSSVEYDSHDITTDTEAGRLAHITNHCVQATSNAFSAFEEGNELWREHLDSVVRYKGRRMREKGIMLHGANPDLEPSLKNTILPQIHHIIVDTMLAARECVPQTSDSLHCFQVFGYDFLIDQLMRVWLLEINGAPGVAERLLPHIVSDTIEVALTPFFPNITREALQKDELTNHNGYVKIYP